MLPTINRRRMARVLALLLVGLMLGGLAPSGSTSAQGVSEIQYLDNDQGEFADGIFERTSISSEDNAALPEDEAGTVQLAPAGILNPWGLAVEGMPTNISNYGLVALGDYLYAVGGELGGETGGARSDKVYAAKINRVTGSPDITASPIWKEFTMPTEQAMLVGESFCAELGRTAAGRTRNGAASLQLPAGGNLGYIYVVGGVVDTECRNDVTTPLVQIATVGANGDITGWVRAPYLPTVNIDGTLNTTNPRGLADPMVTIVRTSTNERFIYVIGGIGIDSTVSPIRRSIYRSVVYAKINVSNGSLVNPLDGSTTQPWAAAAPIDFVDISKTGLRDGVAVSARATQVDNNSSPPVVRTIDAILLAGGCHDIVTCNDRHPYVLKAEIANPSTGALTWDNTPSTDNSQVSLPARSGLGGAFYNGKLYLIGGSTTGSTTGGTFAVPTAIFDSNLNAIKVSGSGDFFVGTTEQVLPAGSAAGDSGRRSELSVAVMPSLPPENQNNVTVNAAWVFAGGGYSDAQASPRVRTLIVGKVGGDDEAQSTLRSRDGWYYSSIEPVSIDGKLARVLTLRWSAAIDRAINGQADIRVEFRKTVTADRQCQDEDFSTAQSDRWRLVDGDTASPFYSRSNTPAAPFNIIELDKVFPQETFEATCLQFRAQFLQNGQVTNQPSPAPSGTPKLFSFSLEKVLAGSPDIKVNELVASRTAKGSIRDVTVAIENLADGGLRDTLDVVEVTNKGSFFVHLCLAKGPLTGDFPALNMAQPGSGGNKPDCAQAYYEVFNVQMTKGTVLGLPATGWRDPDSPFGPVDLRDLFNEPGKYRIGVVIDYVNVIPEGIAGEANNRGERNGSPNGLTFDIEITAPRQYELYLPTTNQ